MIVDQIHKIYNNAPREEWTSMHNWNSYSRDYGRSLYDKVIELKPRKIIEFGPKFGYSTLCMAAALSDLGNKSVVETYDLWHTKYDVRGYDGFSLFAQAAFEKCIDTVFQEMPELAKYVQYGRKDYYQWLEEPSFDFDLLYLDVNNTGDTISKTYNRFKDYIKKGAAVIFAGGNELKDNHRKYKKFPPIFPLKSKIGYTIIYDNGQYESLSMMGDHQLKKQENSNE